MAKEKNNQVEEAKEVKEVAAPLEPQEPIVVKIEDPAPVVPLRPSKNGRVILAQRDANGNAIDGTEFEVSEFTARHYPSEKYVTKKK